MRITILEACYLVTIPTGIALGAFFLDLLIFPFEISTIYDSHAIAGSYLFKNVLNQSYFVMFSINAALLTLAVLYSILRLKVSLQSIDTIYFKLFAQR